MSIKRQRKAERRNARRRKTASPTKAPQHAEVGDSARGVPHPDSVKLSDLFAMAASNGRGPGEELAYDYCAGDHGWFVVPRAGEPFELPLTGELESSWGLLAVQNPACAPVSERIRALRAAMPIGESRMVARNGRGQHCAFGVADQTFRGLVPAGSLCAAVLTQLGGDLPGGGRVIGGYLGSACASSRMTPIPVSATLR